MKIKMSELSADARAVFNVTKRLERLGVAPENAGKLEREELALIYNLIAMAKSHELDELQQTIERII